jgi:hypothetical protein
MLDLKTIETLMLLPEVDMDKATKLQFVNSDKPAVDTSLGANQLTTQVAFAISKRVDEACFAAQVGK